MCPMAMFHEGVSNSPAMALSSQPCLLLLLLLGYLLKPDSQPGIFRNDTVN